MENLGCITFREVLLLIDPDNATQPELQTAAAVINHELAHMWFGDLVTMKCVGGHLVERSVRHLHGNCLQPTPTGPIGRCGTHFVGDVQPHSPPTRSSPPAPSSFPCEHPPKLRECSTFSLTRRVPRWFECWSNISALNDSRDGVRHYLSTHAYANTDTSDLWDCMETTSGEPVRRIMDGWIYQGGYPLVELTETAHGVAVSQRPFVLDPASAFDPSGSDHRTWAVPLSIRQHRGAREDRSERFLLDGPVATLTGHSVEDILTVNADASGFFRVRPTQGAIAAAVSGDLTPSERHAVVDDTWALTVAGEISAQSFVETALGFVDETDLTVWQALAGSLGHLKRLIDDEPKSASLYTRDVGTLANRALERIGVQPKRQRQRPGARTTCHARCAARNGCR